ncbi:MAG: thiamine phosphate synthase [Nocardioides sp.]|nr:thiamine phosphate synthase [Nocardioides sp.]
MARTAVDLDLSLYLVTDVDAVAATGRDLVDTAVAAVTGGATTVQLRAKHLPVREQVELTLRLADALPTDTPLLVNDRVDVVLAARARGARVAGVHLGQTDLDPADARALLGPDAALGLSTGTPARVRAAAAAGVVDYLGLGAFRPTATKPDAPPALGLDGVAALVRASPLPTVAIGGIGPADAAALRRTGVGGIAVVSAVCAAPDPRAAAAALATAWAEASA